MYETKQKTILSNAVALYLLFSPLRQNISTESQDIILLAGNITWKNKITSCTGIFSPKPASVFWSRKSGSGSEKRKQPDFIDEPEKTRAIKP